MKSVLKRLGIICLTLAVAVSCIAVMPISAETTGITVDESGKITIEVETAYDQTKSSAKFNTATYGDMTYLGIAETTAERPYDLYIDVPEMKAGTYNVYFTINARVTCYTESAAMTGETVQAYFSPVAFGINGKGSGKKS